MEILPPQDHPIWKKLVSGEVQKEFKFLAANILMMRIRSSIETDSSPAKIEQYSVELRELFNKNLVLPSVREDLKNITA